MAKRFFSYNNTAVGILSTYKKEIPLHHFLKQFFAKDKKYGSKDRRWISHFCYCFYRLGKSLVDLPLDERLKIGVYLCTENLLELEGYFPEDWPLEMSLDEKIAFAGEKFDFSLEDIFPFRDLMMSNIDVVSLAKSMLVQPDVFLRIRPKRTTAVLQKLEKAGVIFKNIDGAIAINNRTSIDKILSVNREVVVQDLNSQKIAQLFPDVSIQTIWDCCAASGGKTILVHDQYPQARISVSDLRSSILRNHRERMAEAGIAIDNYTVADLEKNSPFKTQFDFVICDAPCSGSGTWGRNPEELYFFEPDSLSTISRLQQNIVKNIWDNVKSGGYLLYITCSLFEKENNIVSVLQESDGMILVKEMLLTGYEIKADTLYGILLTKKV